MKIVFSILIFLVISFSIFVNIGFGENREQVFLTATAEQTGSNETAEQTGSNETAEQTGSNETAEQTGSNEASNIMKNKKNSQTYAKSELDKLIEIMRKNEEIQWREGDVLIASATVLGFFGFASFLTIQFRGQSQNRAHFLHDIDTVLMFMFVIQLLQLYTMGIIVLGFFDDDAYLIIIILIAISLLAILMASRKIIKLQNSRISKISEGDKIIQGLKEKMYTHRMVTKAKMANKELEKMKKEENRDVKS